MKNQPEVTIQGQGTLTNGTAFYLVSSSTELGRCHVVAVQGSRTHCDCAGFSYRGRCKHAALVAEQLAPRKPAGERPQSMLNRTRAFSLMK